LIPCFLFKRHFFSESTYNFCRTCLKIHLCLFPPLSNNDILTFCSGLECLSRISAPCFAHHSSITASLSAVSPILFIPTTYLLIIRYDYLRPLTGKFGTVTATYHADNIFMKIAITAWNGRISPVFDVSRQVVVMEAKDGRIINRQEHDLESSEPSAKVIRLTELGIDTLICGAVSRPLADMIVARGIKLVPFVAGETDHVAEAYLTGNLLNTAFAMPGCCGRRRRSGWFWGGQNTVRHFGGRQMPI